MNEYGEVLENVDLKKYNTYGIGGRAKYLIYPSSVDNLKKLLHYLSNNEISWIVLGGGSNVILPDEDFSGAIIKLDKLDKYEVDDKTITVASGLPLTKFINNMLSDGFTNYANILGIPGTVGGAIRGNVGAFGKCIFDDLISVTIMDENGNIQELKKEDINFEYRYTSFKDTHDIIIEAKFLGQTGNIAEALQKIKENAVKRKNTQPLEYKNAGSVFKNPLQYSAGYVIEHSGLKGFAIGGAKVSEKHANFIINYDNAKSSDIIKLINIIEEEVYKKFKIKLKLEQEIIKW